MENLPIELTEKIIIASVIQELQERYLQESWDDRARERLNELKTVCRLWRSIIQTKGFKVAFGEDLDFSMYSYNFTDSFILAPLMSKESEEHEYDTFVTKLKDKLYIVSYNMYDETNVLYVYLCKDNDFEIENRFNMSGLDELRGMVACHESLYFLNAEYDDDYGYVRLMKVPVERPDSALIMVEKLVPYSCSYHKLSVTNNGDPIVCETDVVDQKCKVMIFDRSGSISQCVDLSHYEPKRILAMTQSSNGKIILLFHDVSDSQRRTIAEVDMDSNIICLYNPKELQDMCYWCYYKQSWLIISLADGRICFIDPIGCSELGCLAVFDSNYNFCSVKRLANYSYDEARKTAGVYYDVEKRQLILVSSNIRIFDMNF